VEAPHFYFNTRGIAYQYKTQCGQKRGRTASTDIFFHCSASRSSRLDPSSGIFALDRFHLPWPRRLCAIEL